jgi:hypothetical protein
MYKPILLLVILLLPFVNDETTINNITKDIILYHENIYNKNNKTFTENYKNRK